MKSSRLIIPLKTKNLFDKTFNSKKLVKNNVYLVKYLINNLPTTRFAIAVGKKYFKHATLRNRIRRQIRSMLSVLSAKPIDLIVIVNPKYLEQSFATNKAMITNLYNSININVN